MKRAVLFDLDGTLVDSLVDMAQGVNKILQKYGLPVHAQQEYRGFVGWGSKVLIQKAAYPMTDELLIEKMHQEYIGVGAALCSRPRILYPGIAELLAALRREGFLLGVVSNKPQEQVAALEQSTFPGMLDLMMGKQECFPPKPDPASTAAALERLGTAPQNTVYLGDSDVDIELGRRAGLYTICVTWGYQDREHLLSCAPQAAADTVEQAHALILEYYNNKKIDRL